MASLGKSPGKAARKETRPRSPNDKKRGKPLEESSSTMCEEQSSSTTLNGEDIQALAIRPEHLEKLRAPQPPKDSQKPRATTRVLVHKTRPREKVRTGVKVTVARPLPQDAADEAQPFDYTGPGGPRFDARGMVLPHSILGSLCDFRREMEARGEAELVKRIPDLKTNHPPESGQQKNEERTKSLPYNEQDLQGHALQHWNYHMAERRRQQNFISQLLQKPVEDLLMNQSSRFREIQEQREIISRGLPALQPGHGHRVGSEFWSVPQRFGDELSGITATLTQTEKGNPQPITHIAQPQSTRLESGTVSEGSVSRAWSHSQYLHHRQHELRDILREIDFNQPDMDGLEVVGSNQPFSSLSGERSPLLEEDEQEEDEERMEGEHKETEDPLALYDDVMLDVELFPALRFCGELARWTGSATSHQEEVGVSARLTFEAVVGERAHSHLELKNEGSTAIYYSWQRVARPHSFTEARAQIYTQHFYFNNSTAVILPGDTERIQFTFKSVYPGIMSEVWQLHTHPVLLGGASLQVTLRGVALYQDKAVEQRAALELELEQRTVISLCKSMVYDVLRNIHTPERPSSPAHLYTTEEEHFSASNPNLHYHHKPVEALKSLWEQAHGHQVAGSGEAEDGHKPVEIPVWDLSVDHLRQVVLCLPQEDTDSGGVLCREEALRQYNSLILQLHQPQPPTKQLAAHCIGLQLWRELCDGLANEALWIRHTLGLSENNNWGDSQPEQDNSGKMKKEEKTERKGALLNKEEKKGGNGNEKEEKKGALKPAATLSEIHGHSKKRLKDEKKVAAGSKDREASSTAASPEKDNSQEDNLPSQLEHKYVHTLHQQVYVLMERMIDSLCELLDEAEQHEDDLHESY